MKTRPLLALSALILLAATALATTFTSVPYDGIAAGDDTLTLTATSGSFTIPADATITVYDANGNALVPQPPLAINPNQGTGTSSCTIAIDGPGSFPTGGKVVVSKLSTTDSNPKPSGDFSNPP